MKTKNSTVNILGLEPVMFSALKTIELCCKIANGDSYEITITSARDGSHMKNSHHYVGLAIDIRSRDMSNVTDSAKWIDKFLNINGKSFDIVIENDHIHIEFDKK